MATRYNNKRIVKSIQTIGVGRLLPGMILTFNYSEQGVKDPRPILLYLNTNKETKNKSDDILLNIFKIKNKSTNEIVKISSERVGKDSLYSLNSNKIRKETKWKPKVSLTNGLIKTSGLRQNML